MKKGRRFGDIVSNVYLILLSIVAVFPLLWLLVSAFKSSSEMLNNPTKIWPIQWTLANFKTVLFTLKFTVNIRNSLTDGSSGTTFKNVVLDGVTLNQQNLKAAAIFIAMLPIICVYPFVQKYFKKGILIGSVKG